MVDAMCHSRVRDLDSADVSGCDPYDLDIASPDVEQISHIDEEDDYSDMASFIDPSLIVRDPAAVTTSPATFPAQVRRYQITITYDNAYRTPRVYLRGFQADTGSPLSTDEMMEDVMQDYVAKTATIEAHPHSGEAYLSIHPCRHAHTMRRLVETMIAGGDVPPVELYLFIFLKFISSMIPTIDYDQTMSIAIGPPSEDAQ